MGAGAMRYCVNPGFGGQAFIPTMVPKICRLKEICDRRNLTPWIEGDSGLNPSNTWQVLEAGATAIVAGSAIFKTGNYGQAIDALRRSKRPG